MTLDEPTALLFPIPLVRLNRFAGVESFQRQLFKFLLGLFVVTSNPFDVSLHGKTLGLSSGSKSGFEFGMDGYADNRFPSSYSLILRLITDSVTSGPRADNNPGAAARPKSRSTRAAQSAQAFPPSTGPPAAAESRPRRFHKSRKTPHKPATHAAPRC